MIYIELVKQNIILPNRTMEYLNAKRLPAMTQTARLDLVRSKKESPAGKWENKNEKPSDQCLKIRKKMDLNSDLSKKKRTVGKFHPVHPNQHVHQTCSKPWQNVPAAKTSSLGRVEAAWVGCHRWDMSAGSNSTLIFTFTHANKGLRT